jgi:hypothetical protein
MKVKDLSLDSIVYKGKQGPETLYGSVLAIEGCLALVAWNDYTYEWANIRSLHSWNNENAEV